MHVICGKIKINGLRQKYRICERNSIVKFRKATLFSQGDMLTGTFDLHYSSKMFRGGLFYHQVCLPAYVNNSATNENNNKTELKGTNKRHFLSISTILQKYI